MTSVRMETKVKPETIVVSIAPGKTIAWLTELFGKEVKLVRCMPNTPALVGEGCTGVIRKSRLTGEDFHQRCDHADAEALLVCRLRQKDRYHIGRDHPVRREACHRWRHQMQQHPDRQHQCGNRQPAETPAPRLDKDKLRYIFHLFHFISPFTGSYSSNKIKNPFIPLLSSKGTKGSLSAVPPYLTQGPAHHR